MWDSIVTTDVSSLVNFESELTDFANISPKLSIAKKLLTLKLEVELRKLNKALTKNSITNPEIFILPLEFLCLELVFEDLSNGQDDLIYGQKTKKYQLKFNQAFSDACTLMELDIDGDCKPDIKPITTGVTKR